MSQFEFIGTDVGMPLHEGSTKTNTGGYDIAAYGTDIWDNADEFHFAHVSYSGDFDIKVRLEMLTKADLYTKAGIMARESLDADSSHAYFLAFPDNSPRNRNNGGYEFQYREEKGSTSTAIYPSDYSSETPQFPVNFPDTWLRLKRQGNEFQAWYSAEGETWILYGAKVLPLQGTLYLGMAVTSHNIHEQVAASFRNLDLK
jgi:regulation of enolase protein 1 (concanavalin A-like superfamily)